MRERPGESAADRREALTQEGTEGVREMSRVRARPHHVGTRHRDVERDTMAGHTAHPDYFLSCVTTTTSEARAVNTDAIVPACVKRLVESPSLSGTTTTPPASGFGRESGQSRCVITLSTLPLGCVT